MISIVPYVVFSCGPFANSANLLANVSAHAITDIITNSSANIIANSSTNICANRSSAPHVSAHVIIHTCTNSNIRSRRFGSYSREVVVHIIYSFFVL